MLKRRGCSNIAYIVLFFLICITVWQIATKPYPIPDLKQYPTVYTLYTKNTTSYVHPVETLSSSDYHQLIDLKFTFSILNLVCNTSTPPLLLVVVHSGSDNIHKRNTVRKTWGKNTNQIRVVFMVGSVQNQREQKNLEAENEFYNDLVQGTFLDTYRNLTYKHVMVLKYAIYHCPHARYILKTDDDVFVNMPSLLNFIKYDLSPYGASKLFYCPTVKSAIVWRSYRSRYRVNYSEYPNARYPTYCSGWVLLYSPDVVFRLYKEAQKAEYFWIDDVHITGTVAERVRLVHSNIENLVVTESIQDEILLDPTRNVSQPFLFGRPNLDPEKISTLWKYAKIHKAPKSFLKQLFLGSGNLLKNLFLSWSIG